jgi:hypothetical protein
LGLQTSFNQTTAVACSFFFFFFSLYLYIFLYFLLVAPETFFLVGEFVNSVVRELLERWRTKHSRSRPRHPQTNGLREKDNFTLISRLRAWLDSHPDDNWVTALPHVVCKFSWHSQLTALTKSQLVYFSVLLNSEIASSTGKAPYHLMFGQAPRLTTLPKIAAASPLTALASGSQQLRQLLAFGEVSRFHVGTAGSTSLLMAALHSSDLSVFTVRVRQALPSRVERLLPEWISQTLQSEAARAWQPPDGDWRKVKEDLEAASADLPTAINFTPRHVALLLHFHETVLAVMDAALTVSILLAKPTDKVSVLSWNAAVVLAVDGRHESVCVTHEGELRQVLSLDTCAPLFKVAYRSLVLFLFITEPFFFLFFFFFFSFSSQHVLAKGGVYDPALGEPGIPSYQARMEATDQNARQRDRMARRWNAQLELESFQVGQAVGVFIDHAQRRKHKIQSSVIPGVIVQTDPGKDAAQTKYTVKYVLECHFFFFFFFLFGFLVSLWN